NRTMPGKRDTFVLDFVNTEEEIFEAFQPFYEATTLKEGININLIYDTQSKLRKYNIYNDDDVKAIIKISEQAQKKQDERLLGRMSSVFKPVINSYEELEDDVKYEFRVTLRNFNKWYNYISQIDRTFDKKLLEESIFTGFLLKFIPKEKREKVNIDDKVKLEYYKLQQDFKGEISLVAEDEESGAKEHPESVDATVNPPDERDSLEEIIQRINERFPEDFTEGDRVLVETLDKTLKKHTDARMLTMARDNSEEMLENNLLKDQFQDTLLEQYTQGEKAYGKMFDADQSYFNTVYSLLAKDLYKWLRSQDPQDYV